MNCFILIENETSVVKKKKLIEKFIKEISLELANTDETNPKFTKLHSDLDLLKVMYEEAKMKSAELLDSLR